MPTGEQRMRLLRTAVIAFIVLRLVVTVISGLAVTYGDDVETIDPAARDMLDEPSLDEGVAGVLLGPWQRQDALRYLRIARDGYATDADSVFAPAYPLMIRAVAMPLGGGGQARVVAALLISNVAALVAFYLFLRLISRHFGEATGRRALLALVVFPTSFFLVAAYTESLFLCFMLASLLRLDEERHVEAGLFGALAALSRLTGWVVAVPLLWSVWTRRRQIIESGPVSVVSNLVFAGLPVAAAGGFLGYRHLAGLPPISNVYEGYWLTSTSWPGKALLRALGWIVTGSVPEKYGMSFRLDVLSMLLALGACVWGFGRMPRPWWLYTVMATLFVLLPDSYERTVNSTSRYVLVIFPIFVMLAGIRRLPAMFLSAISVLLGLMFLWSSANWYWVA
jgi:hypothetical protein